MKAKLAFWAALAVSAVPGGALAFGLRAPALGGGACLPTARPAGRRGGGIALCTLASAAAGEPPQTHHSRRAAVLAFASATSLLVAGPAPARAVDAVIQASDALPAGAQQPSPKQTQVIKDAIQAFDQKQLAKAESLFTQGIETWCAAASVHWRGCARARPSWLGAGRACGSRQASDGAACMCQGGTAAAP